MKLPFLFLFPMAVTLVSSKFNTQQGFQKHSVIQTDTLTRDRYAILPSYDRNEKRDVLVSDLPKPATSYQWFGITYNDNKSLFIEPIPTPMAAVQPPESLYAGEKSWHFKPYGRDSSFFLVGSEKTLSAKRNIPYVHFNLSVSEKTTFLFNGQSYELQLNGIVDNNTDSEDTPGALYKNYELVLIHKDKKQTLFHHASGEFQFSLELSITDVDGDQLPDIICALNNSPRAYDLALFLSSEAEGANLLRLVAHYEPCSC